MRKTVFPHVVCAPHVLFPHVVCACWVALRRSTSSCLNTVLEHVPDVLFSPPLASAPSLAPPPQPFYRV
eukprot:364266-Chlamydomonas_euryale.AAC.3